MKKFLNDPVNFVDEMLEGIYKAHPAVTHAAGDLRCLVTAKTRPGKVGIATGGGSGHLPTFLGFVGDGMLDGAAVGGVFQSPSAEQMYQVTKHIDQGAGVLYIYGNYTGDIINFDMAAELADLDGIAVRQVVGNDDVASSVVGEEHKRRGVAGIFFLYKTAGAAAAEGQPLDEVTRLADKARLRTRTMGVALSSCVVPEIGHATFTIGDDEMEIGMGIHGEPGVERGPLRTADEIVDDIIDKIFAEMAPSRGDRVAVLVNSLGSTPLMELYIMNRRVAARLADRGVDTHATWVGNYCTSLEMAGASITLHRLDGELQTMLDHPCDCAMFRAG
jgi:dihydroxyacetone kinase-like protein